MGTGKSVHVYSLESMRASDKCLFERFRQSMSLDGHRFGRRLVNSRRRHSSIVKNGVGKYATKTKSVDMNADERNENLYESITYNADKNSGLKTSFDGHNQNINFKRGSFGRRPLKYNHKKSGIVKTSDENNIMKIDEVETGAEETNGNQYENIIYHHQNITYYHGQHGSRQDGTRTKSVEVETSVGSQDKNQRHEYIIHRYENVYVNISSVHLVKTF